MSNRTEQWPFSLVFRPGDPAGSRDNIYVTWGELMLAVASIEGAKTVLIDGSITTPVVIPAGAYDMDGAVIAMAQLPSAGGVLQIVDGVTFTNLRGIIGIGEGAPGIVYTGTSGPAITLGLNELIEFREGLVIQCTGTQPFISSPAPFSGVALLEGAAFDGSGGQEVWDVSAGSAALLILASGSSAAPSSISGGAGSSLLVIYLSGAAQLLKQPSFLGTIAIQTSSSTIATFRERLTPTPTKSGAYIADFNELVRCDPTGGGFTVTLPEINGSIGTAGWKVVVKNIGASANVITVAPDATGPDFINGTTTIAAAQGALTFVSDGVSSWEQI